jgi:hypothetical protein
MCRARQHGHSVQNHQHLQKETVQKLQKDLAERIPDVKKRP